MDNFSKILESLDTFSYFLQLAIIMASLQMQKLRMKNLNKSA